ncbi:branched-chain amino acid--2-keto-4-methylthiobutyrate aminotransferase [Rhodopseudomonas boonkerdii]|uniref:aminotransferase class IV n=1 Tax=Rhodopseudomonas boonkerdii TaxID=475937 RepID=UPI001E337EA7|nr:aminotransferase class IV [Rhodopseudomonas boonkerdii]UGV25434.1 branched-chain amino acid--2-keto-4-methylthiobutyrate aminotransferase [Rhodopseudomonas boonkerdii]
MQEQFRGGAAFSRGAFVPVAEASVSPLDWAFTRSDVVYDVVHVFEGGFFRLADHLDRFEASMRARRLAPPETRSEMEAILHRCVALAGLDDAYVAMVALRGRPRIAGSRRIEDCDNHFMAYAVPWIDVIPKDAQARGAHVWIATRPRVPDVSVDPTVKNYQWSDLTSGLFEAQDHGVDTAIVCDADGFVTEGPGFNVFMVKDGKVRTPDRGSLHGITRRTVLELCGQMGIDAAVAPIRRHELEDADEVFLATTAGGVMPAARVNGTILGNDRPGPISLRIKDAYWQMHRDGIHRTDVIRDA